jgi:hypothetical protein
MIRPTKSRGRFVQCAGRGLRLLGDTLEESRRNGKTDCLLLDFTGLAAKHRLIGPADCLLGADEDIPDDIRDEIERQLAAAQLPIAEVMDHAKSEVERRRSTMRIQAVVRYHAEHIDPFVGTEDRSALPPCPPAWEDEPASERQLEALDELGVTLANLPKWFSRAEAWRLLARLKPRVGGGLCSYKAAKKLAQAGVRNTAALSHNRAKELLDKLRQGEWRPRAIANEPEVRDARGAA